MIVLIKKSDWFGWLVRLVKNMCFVDYYFV